MRNDTWSRVGWSLFGTGWGFLVPYLLLALGGAWLGASIPVVLTAFRALHLVVGGLFLLWAGSRLSRLSPGSLLFWLALALLFFLPGAYLEFPSDPWDHYRRILQWGRHQGDLTLAALVDEFGFFWNASLVCWVPASGHRLALAVVSAFWQLLLGWQFYRFFRQFGDPLWAGLQVVGTVALFGTNLFGFYRYYALSATPLAYIAYLQALIVVGDLLDRWLAATAAERRGGSTVRALGILGICLLLIVYNHLQELMLLGISTAGLVFAVLWEHPRWRRRVVGATIALFATALLIGGWIVATYRTAPSPWGPAFDELGHVSALGTFRLWDLQLPYLETLGVHGVLGVCGAIVLFHRRPRLASLTLAPIAMALFPPFVFLFGAIYHSPTYGWITYRVLFTFPASVMLIEGLLVLWRVLKERELVPPGRFVGLAVVGLVAVFIGLFHQYPVRGRLWFQLYRPEPVLALSGTEEAARWFQDRPEWEPSCLVAGDHATQWVLSTHFGTPRPPRLRAGHVGDDVDEIEELRARFRREKACGLLVAMPEGSIPLSKVGKDSLHWVPPIVRGNLVPADRFREVLKEAKEGGWRVIEVPPYYELYAPPWIRNEKSA